MNLPKVKAGKKAKFTLGVSDKNLLPAIQDALNFPGNATETTLEMMRGIRLHFDKFVKELDNGALSKAQLGLGHSYSRAKVKFNVNRQDNMIIQAICLLDQLDKDINTFAMRVREWYSWHFPELVKIVKDNYVYARAASYIKNRSNLTEDKIEGLAEILMDEDKAKEVLNASRTSMGMDMSDIDMINVDNFTSRLIKLAEYRKELYGYLQDKMALVAPNLATLIGDTVGARLISHAGSLTNLAKAPASTVQILGAEKALFRALKTRGNTPKYGLIFHSSFIGRAGAKNKGRISRYLANKCSIASRIDAFSDESTSVFGSKLKEQVEDRLKFYETGDLPRKNVEVMAEAVEEAAEEIAKKKKKKKRKAEDGDSTADVSAMDTTAAGDTTVEEPSEPPKKKKKKKKDADVDTTADITADITADLTTDIADVESSQKKKKKKKDKSKDKDESVNGDVSLEEAVPVIGSEKKKKKKKAEAD